MISDNIYIACENLPFQFCNHLIDLQRVMCNWELKS